MLLKQANSLDLFVDPVLAEHYAEVFQDADRAGYLNLGNASNGPIWFTATNDAFINCQGGDDTIVMIGTTNDTIHGGSGDDYIDGQAGNDTLFGDSGNDTLRGGDGDDSLFGGSGSDGLSGGTGNDLLDGGTGDDLLYGEAGNDTLKGGLGNDTLDGGTGDDIVDGGVDNDVLHGGIGNDVLRGGDGDDQLFGDAGDDVLNGGLGTNHFDGGAGFDTVDYRDAGSGVSVWLDNRVLNGSGIHDQNFNFLSHDTYTSIEMVQGSNYADGIFGDSGDNVINGNGGDDIIYGGNGNDTINGGTGDDIIQGGVGADHLDGGSGINTLSYRDAWSGVTVNLATMTASGGDAAGDTITNFDNVFGSSTGGDKLIGSSGNNVLLEHAGDNLLTGGGGKDTFAFCDLSFQGAFRGNDTITDFHVGEDRLAFVGNETMKNLHFTQHGADTVITLDNTPATSITLLGVNANDLLNHASTDIVFNTDYSWMLHG